MPQIRRNADRRRRVLYQSHVAPHTPSTPATRRAAEELRAARQPAKAFGSRVHRQLRGRWFSLVPVSRTALTIVVAALATLAISLTALHHLAVTWPGLAYREDIARPLRIDRPDSFAAWWTTMVLVLAAGAMRLIYVLRRHRRDDYRGHYQLWRLTLIVLLVASIHSTVGLVAWLGSFLDLIFGDRAVLSGANWLRIVLDVGGMILAMRLVSEVYRCRPALVAMVSAATFFGLSEAAAWQLMSVDTMTRSTLVIAAPMLGSSCLLVAATIYLRALYRQVRNIADAPTVRERWREWMAERREQDDEKEFDIPEPMPAIQPQQPRQQPTQRAQPTQRPQPAVARDSQPTRPATTRVAKEEASEVDSEADQQNGSKTKKAGFFARFRRQRDESESESDRSESVADESKDGEETGDEKPKRRWFGLRAAKQSDEDEQAESSVAPEPQSSAPKKRRFSLRLKPQQTDALTDASADDSSDSGDDEETKPEKKGWFGGLLGRKKTAEEEDDPSDDAGRSNSNPSRSRSSGPLAARSSQQTAKRASGPLSSAARNTNQNQSVDDDEIIDPDNIDWDSLSKAERRRVRKKLKRSGRAA